MTTEAESIAKLAIASATHPGILAGPGGTHTLFIPAGMSREDVSDPNRTQERPGHIRQVVNLQTVDSLVDYVNAFKTSATVMFADIASNSVSAPLDYHQASDGATAGAADHLFHRAALKLNHSEEWRVWSQISGKMMEQLEFARFLEENAGDIAAPSGADVLEACRDLQAHRKVNFTKAVRTATDNESFEFTQDTEARSKGGLELPTKFLLRIPVYFGGETHDLYAFLRWRLEEAALKLGIVLHRAEHVRQAVFKQIVHDVSSRTERPALFGSAA